ncbi:MAG: tRNA lysidine(34) synthetase TilS, partial [Candidatus Eisenbacteria bacterium]|nr:tRNA lysidine(34) synthetase TilS [Candidatus Eisenbacteria bacterium]
APIARWAREVAQRARVAGSAARQRVELETTELLARPAAVATQAVWLAYQRLSGAERALSGRHAHEILSALQQIERDAVGVADPRAGIERQIHLPGRFRVRIGPRSVRIESHRARPAAARSRPPARGERLLLAASDPLLRPSQGDPLGATRRVELGGLTLQLEHSCAPPADLVRGEIAAFDLDALELPLTVRPWRSGDALVPFGMRGSKKISDLLREQRLPRQQRTGVRVVADRAGILWVVGHRRSARAPITPETRSVLTLRAHATTPVGQESA